MTTVASGPDGYPSTGPAAAGATGVPVQNVVVDEDYEPRHDRNSIPPEA